MLLNVTCRTLIQYCFLLVLIAVAHLAGVYCLWSLAIRLHWIPFCCVQFMTPWCNCLQINILHLLFSRRHADSRTLTQTNCLVWSACLCRGSIKRSLCLWVELHPKLRNQEWQLLDIRLLTGPSPDLDDIAWGLNCLWELHHRLLVSIRPQPRPLCFSCFIRCVYGTATELNLSEALSHVLACWWHLSHILPLTTDRFLRKCARPARAGNGSNRSLNLNSSTVYTSKELLSYGNISVYSNLICIWINWPPKQLFLHKQLLNKLFYAIRKMKMGCKHCWLPDFLQT